MQIFVEMPAGKTLSLDVEPFDRLETLKTKIQDLEGIYCYNQSLVFAGGELEDRKTLSDYNIEQGFTVFLVLKVVEEVIIYIRFPQGKNSKICVRPFDSILDVKYKILLIEGVPVEAQILSLNRNHLELQDDKTLDELLIGNHSSIFIDFKQ